MKLEGRTALVTGASRGLGEALARRLAAAGAKVVLVARDAASVEAVAASIRGSGGDAHAIAADVADKKATHAIAGAAAATIGPIDLLIHNASTLGPLPMPLLLDTACEDLASVLETNLIGPFRLSKAIVGSMLVRGRGLVVHVSSDAAVSAYSRWGAYAVSKAALDHLGRVWGAELDGTGVRFLSIDPGEMDTTMHADAMPDADRTALARPADVAARIVKIIEGDDSFANGARIEASSTDLAKEAAR